MTGRGKLILQAANITNGRSGFSSCFIKTVWPIGDRGKSIGALNVRRFWPTNRQKAGFVIDAIHKFSRKTWNSGFLRLLILLKKKTKREGCLAVLMILTGQ